MGGDPNGYTSMDMMGFDPNMMQIDNFGNMMNGMDMMNSMVNNIGIDAFMFFQ